MGFGKLIQILLFFTVALPAIRFNLLCRARHKKTFTAIKARAARPVWYLQNCIYESNCCKFSKDRIWYRFFFKI